MGTGLGVTPIRLVRIPGGPERCRQTCRCARCAVGMVCRTTPGTGCRDGTDPTLGLSGRLVMGVWDAVFPPACLIPLWDFCFDFHVPHPGKGARGKGEVAENRLYNPRNHAHRSTGFTWRHQNTQQKEGRKRG